MKHNLLKGIWPVITLFVIASLLLAGCGSQPAPTTAPAATMAPAATTVPVATMAAAATTAPVGSAVSVALATSVAKSGQPLKACFFSSFTINDGGWTQSNELGRLYMEAHVKNVVSTMTENISDTGGSDVVKVIEDMISSQGCKVIVGTSYGYSDAIVSEATKHPDIIFLNESQPVGGPNIQSHWYRLWEGFYIMGALAAKMTKDNTICMVATMAVPELMRDLNSYALGAQAVNPNIAVKAVFTNSWYDPAKETEATNSLVAAGCDVVQSMGSDTAALQAADTAGIYSMGFGVDQSAGAPNHYLSSMIINWGPIFASSMQKIIDGTWKPGEIWFGIVDGFDEIGPFGKSVPQDVQASLADLQSKVSSGQIKIWQGPLYDQNGNLKVQTGQVLTDQDTQTMDWLLKGIQASIPTQ